MAKYRTITKITFTLQDIFDSVQYGFNYREESQNNEIKVPEGNILQWLMAKKGLMKIPKEFKEKVIEFISEEMKREREDFPQIHTIKDSHGNTDC